ncbi:putative ribonuclease H protein [Glycine soja]
MMCSPLDEGGLDIPLASLINDAASLKLYWNFVFSNEIWEQFLRVRLLPNSCQVSSYKKSSLWSSFKHHIGLVMDNSIWLLGSSYNTNFWNDSWCLDRSISDVLNLPTSIRRNEKTFNNESVHFDQAYNMIFLVIQLFGFKSNGNMSNFVHEFSILKDFSIDIHPHKAKYIKEVFWRAPQLGTIKCNTDGSAHGSPSHASSNGIFRDHRGGMLGCFSFYIGIQKSLFAEIFAIILALEVARDKGWLKVWIKCDSTLVIQAFSNPSFVPWKQRKRWETCHFFCKYIRRKLCPDRLANVGALSYDSFTWWDSIPIFVMNDFLRNRMSLPNYRLSLTHPVCRRGGLATSSPLQPFSITSSLSGLYCRCRTRRRCSISLCKVVVMAVIPS